MFYLIIKREITGLLMSGKNDIYLMTFAVHEVYPAYVDLIKFLSKAINLIILFLTGLNGKPVYRS